MTVEAAKALDRRALKATRTGRDLAETSKYGGACETREGSLKKQVKGDGAVEIVRRSGAHNDARAGAWKIEAGRAPENSFS